MLESPGSAEAGAPKISICLCTFRRPELLRETLTTLKSQSADFAYEIIVCDNDKSRTAEAVVREMSVECAAPLQSVHYVVEPEQNIALARNRGLAAARGEFVAFIDDDETAGDGWLAKLHESLVQADVTGVFGPVVSRYPSDFPDWIQRAELLPRERFETGTRMKGADGRTGNALILRSALLGRDGPFDRAYGLTGGSDTELLAFLDSQGATFAWADEAMVYEMQDPKRGKPRWYLVRAYRAGWARTKRSVESRGSILGGLETVLKIIPSVAMLGARALRQASNPRACGLLLLMALAGQAGKLGFFLGVRLEEYRVSNESTG